ncbi:hypothetical protein FIBSPDRAFT_177996 [Athelia psychrophila]|uniref:Uncharacterized protein n=1 Tax=Athelia psychrophila TaxID=1759441 RepID=A0A166SPH9_9AGAM|nr:hypothetical protein FIBSPDRAFT_509925 [Fibularhizoctonia sp. CBS 109695]KZP29687.1 hypothetical protein FIBSPDRAFT_177996 [Fibularhizoctonia sp. CBS 109695]
MIPCPCPGQSQLRWTSGYRSSLCVQQPVPRRIAYERGQKAEARDRIGGKGKGGRVGVMQCANLRGRTNTIIGFLCCNNVDGEGGGDGDGYLCAEQKSRRVENVRMRTVLGFEVEARVTVRGRFDMEIDVGGDGDGDRGGDRGGGVRGAERNKAW